jgi:hypothetical protein
VPTGRSSRIRKNASGLSQDEFGEDQFVRAAEDQFQQSPAGPEALAFIRTRTPVSGVILTRMVPNVIRCLIDRSVDLLV